MQESAVPDAPDTAPTPDRAAAWEDLIDIYYAPAQVFARRLAEPVIWLPLLVLAGAIALLGFASAGILEPMWQAEFERNVSGADTQLSPEDLERMRGFSSTMGVVMAPIGVAFGALVLGLIIWLVARVFASSPAMAATLMVGVLSQFPRIPQQLALLFQGAVMDPSAMNSRFALSLGPARFVDPATTSELMMVTLERFDLFTLWVTLLVGVGFHVVARLPRGQAAAAAMVVWLVGSLPMVLGAATG
jgi:hypothetical protein